MSRKIKGVVVTPTYNEAKNIGKTIEKMLSVFKKIPNYEMKLLVVDDSSPDGTGEVVKQYQSKNKLVRLFTNKQKAGLGKAYLVGLSYAYEKMGAEVAVQMDADGQHRAIDLPGILRKLDEGYDLVVGSRYIKGGAVPEKWGVNRKVMSSLGNFVARVVLGKYIPHDWTTGYRAIRKRVFMKIRPAMKKRREFTGYAWMIGQLSLALDSGFKVGEAPIKFVMRTHGESKLSAEYIKNTLLFLIKKRIGAA